MDQNIHFKIFSEGLNITKSKQKFPHFESKRPKSLLNTMAVNYAIPHVMQVVNNVTIALKVSY